jgi:hypothetical protein
VITRYRISLGGVELDSLDDNIAILDIEHTQPDRSVRKQTVANLPGYDIADTYVGQRTVAITFELHIYDVAERNAACQTVNAWAKAGGTLKVMDREHQHLENVVCEQFADIASAKNWTDPLTLVFATTNNPYWVSDDAITKSMTGKTTSGTLSMDGNIGSSLVSAEVTANASISSVQINVGSTMLKLTGLSLVTNQKMTIDYLKGRYLRIRSNNQSLMARLDPSSSDNLSAECGASSNIAVNANASVTTVLTARGCWM